MTDSRKSGIYLSKTNLLFSIISSMLFTIVPFKIINLLQWQAIKRQTESRMSGSKMWTNIDKRMDEDENVCFTMAFTSGNTFETFSNETNIEIKIFFSVALIHKLILIDHESKNWQFTKCTQTNVLVKTEGYYVHAEALAIESKSTFHRNHLHVFQEHSYIKRDSLHGNKTIYFCNCLKPWTYNI